MTISLYGSFSGVFQNFRACNFLSRSYLISIFPLASIYWASSWVTVHLRATTATTDIAIRTTPRIRTSLPMIPMTLRLVTAHLLNHKVHQQAQVNHPHLRRPLARPVWLRIGSSRLIAHRRLRAQRSVRPLQLRFCVQDVISRAQPLELSLLAHPHVRCLRTYLMALV